MKNLFITIMIFTFSFASHAERKEYVSLPGYNGKIIPAHKTAAFGSDEDGCQPGTSCFKHRQLRQKQLMSESKRHIRHITGKEDFSKSSTKTRD